MNHLTLRWDHRLELWKGHVDPPGTGSEPGLGPPGPAGVAVLRAGDAVINTCKMTGRITDVYLHDELDQEERDALTFLFEDAPHEIAVRLADEDRRPFRLDARPVAERRPLLEVVDLLEAVDRADLAEQPEALALVWVEMAAALGEFAGQHDSASLFGDRNLLPDALASADTACGAVFASELLPLALDRSRVGLVVERLRVAQRIVPTSGGARAIDLLDQYLKLGDLGVGASLASGSVIEAARPDGHDEVSASNVFVIRPEVTHDDFELSRGAEEALRLRPHVGVTLAGRWVILSLQDDDQDDRAPAIWVRAFDQEHRLVGASQLSRGDDGQVIAEVAVQPGAEIAEWEFESNPFGRPERGVPYGRLDHAAAISSAAWVARRRDQIGVAEVLFARSTIAWLYLGQMFRAAWAWSLADQQSVRDDLTKLGWGHLDAALDAVVDSGDIPDVPRALADTPLPLWMQAVKIESLVPPLPRAAGLGRDQGRPAGG